MRRARRAVVTFMLVLAAACGGRTIDPSTESKTEQPTTDAAGAAMTRADEGGPVDASTDDEVEAGDPGAPSMCTAPASSSMLPPSVQVTDGCPAAPPCGGDPTGTWNVVETCVLPFDLDPFPTICPGAGTGKTSVDVTNGTSQVRLAFDGMHLNRTVVTTMDLRGTFPAACFPGHEGDSCADKGASLAATFPGATCSPSGDASTATSDCQCQLTITTNASCSNGYTVSGTKLLLDDGNVFDFCVVSSFINMRQVTATTSSIVAPGLYHASRQ